MPRNPHPSGATVSKLHGTGRRPNFARLARFWVILMGATLTGALVLQALGPPAHRAGTPTIVREAEIATAIRRDGSPPGEPDAQHAGTAHAPHASSLAAPDLNAAAPDSAHRVAGAAPQAASAVPDHAQPSPPAPEPNLSRALPSQTAAGRDGPPPPTPLPDRLAAVSQPPTGQPAADPTVLRPAVATAADAHVPSPSAASPPPLPPPHSSLDATQVQSTAPAAVASRQGSDPVASSTHSVAARVPLGEHHRSSRQNAASPARPRTVHEMLQSAQAALAGNNDSAARGLLESAETAIVFQPNGGRGETASIAASQISRALRELNNGDRALASQYVGQAAMSVGTFRDASQTGGGARESR